MLNIDSPPPLSIGEYYNKDQLVEQKSYGIALLEEEMKEL
jgi:hypothetical protein